MTIEDHCSNRITKDNFEENINKTCITGCNKDTTVDHCQGKNYLLRIRKGCQRIVTTCKIQSISHYFKIDLHLSQDQNR